MKCAVVVTGLPAGGKTTIARELAQRLGFELLDKDDFLESLFERFEVRSAEDRTRLSRQSDHAFKAAALQAGSAVLVSHWRALGDNNESGTPSDWLSLEYGRIVEVCCLCSPETAQMRFLSRSRHPGHLDRQCDIDLLSRKMASWMRRFPLGIGVLVEAETEGGFDIGPLAEEIREALARG
ncbi:hypothetical protein RSK20926_13064 [Roseobacter sp. SK209-2-6]|uniref:AAA family ATPase n=1 Tax=Roseobacter sp. SK209-2-6 TaxID=388739 RepID=UPI0000F3C526|nr:AAA family ATPase [Roseobacter sp. SK209-2-6]EBA18654.1 hypothetical protein RSK20926_13064 [Roseobacter sp. SK209-2-6]